MMPLMNTCTRFLNFELMALLQSTSAVESQNATKGEPTLRKTNRCQSQASGIANVRIVAGST